MAAREPAQAHAPSGRKGSSSQRSACWQPSASGQSATAYFRIPPDQVVELGIQLES
jgi:hypothetical protein